MAAIRYGIAGRPVDHSLSPLLTALVVKHLGLVVDDKHLSMELVDVSTVTDAFAWGYAGAVPEPIPWAYTQSVFNKFRTKALLSKAVDAAMQVTVCHPVLATEHAPRIDPQSSTAGLPTRMFEEEIWLNLTAPLKHTHSKRVSTERVSGLEVESACVAWAECLPKNRKVVDGVRVHRC